MIKNPLKALGNLNQMRKQAQKMQEELAKETVEVEENGVSVVMSGDQKIKSLVIDGQPDERVKKVLKKAIEKSQRVAAGKLAGMSGGLGGMFQ